MLSAEPSHRGRVQSEPNIGAYIPSHEGLASTSAANASYLFPPSQNQTHHTPTPGPSHSPVHPHHHLPPHIQTHYAPSLLHDDHVSTPGSCTTTAPNTPDEVLLTPINGGPQLREHNSFSSSHASDAGSFSLWRRASRGRGKIQHSKSPLARTVILPSEPGQYSPEEEPRQPLSETQMVQAQASSGQAQAQSGMGYYGGQSYTQEGDEIARGRQPRQQYQQGAIQEQGVEQHQAQVQQHIQPLQYARSQSQQYLMPYQSAQEAAEIQYPTQAPQGLGFAPHPDQTQQGPSQQDIQGLKRPRDPSQA